MADGSIKVTPEDLDQLGKSCKEAGQQLEDIVKGLLTAMMQVAQTWNSDAARKFMADAESFKKNLTAAQMDVYELGENAITMAQNYRQADQAYQS